MSVEKPMSLSEVAKAERYAQQALGQVFVAGDLTIELFEDRVLIERIQREEMTASGLYIPDVAQEKPQEATVKAVGPGRTTEDGRFVPCTLRVGDRVMFGKYSGHELTIKKVEYILLRESEVLCRVKVADEDE